MRTFIVSLGLILTAALVFLFRPVDANEPVFHPGAQSLPLSFRLNRIDGADLEIALQDRQVRGPLFMQFSVTVQGGSPALVLNGSDGRSRLGGAAPGAQLPDWPFLKSSDGQTVLDFHFDNQIGTDEQGNPVLRIRYTGVNVPLVRSLTVARPTTLPPFVSSAVGADGPIQLQQGTYRLDSRFPAFDIPIRVLGRG
jgi:hypothetical protein